MRATEIFVAGCWIVVVVFWIVSAFSVKRAKQRQPLLGRFLYLWVAVVAVLLLTGSTRSQHWGRAVLPHHLGVCLLADLIVLAGLAVALWARATLGRNWSGMVTLKEDHELIQQGPYRRVRHPIYSGLLLMILGTAILAGRVNGFVALLTCFAVLWIKLRLEEKLLTRHLPGYADYMSRTKALVPFVL